VEALYLSAVHNLEKAVADYLEQQLQLGLLTLPGLQKQFSVPAYYPTIFSHQTTLSFFL
jgi:hypothetical protein